MEGDRKYRQRGYNDSDRPQSDNGTFNGRTARARRVRVRLWISPARVCRGWCSP